MSEYKSLYNEFTGDFNTLTADNITVDTLNSEYVYVDVIEPFTLSGSVVVDGYDVAATFNEHEHSLSTGLYNGGLLVIASATTFSITDGAGIIVQNVSNPHAITPVSWTNKTGIAATYINSALITFVSIDSAGVVIQSTSRPTNAETRTQIYLGVLVHTDLATITAVNQQQQFINAPALQVRDLLEAIGPLLNIDGNTIAGNSGALTFTKSAGVILAYGANYYNSPLNPHRLNISSVNTTTTAIEYRQVNGTNYYTNDIPGLVDPAYYESGGVRVAVGVNKFTVQRVFLFTSGNIKLQYGQTQYNTLAAAKDAFRNDPFTIEASIKANGVLIAYIIIKAGTTSLTNTSDCFIINAGKFEGTSASAGGTTLQLSYENSETPEIITDTTRGALTIKRGSASDDDVVLEVLDASGIKSYSATGNNVYFNKLSTGVLHSDISGVITSSPVVAADISGGVAQIIPTLTFTGSYLVPFVDNLNAPANIYVGGLNYNASTQTLGTSYITTDAITEVNEGDGVSLIGARFISGAYLSAGVLHCSASGVITSSRVVDADISGGVSKIIPQLTISGAFLIPLTDNLNTSANIFVGGLNYNATNSLLGTTNLSVDNITDVSEEGISVNGARFISGSYLSAGVLHCSASGVISSSLIVDADIHPSAAVSYSKLNLNNSIINNDIHPSAAIAYTKLNLNNGITNTDINSGAAISYSKLNLSGSIVSNDISGINSSKIVVNSNITPTASGYDLGSVSNRWNNVYCETISANSFTLSGNTLTADYINEATTGSGVVVDGVRLKDGKITNSTYTTGWLRSDASGSITNNDIYSTDVINLNVEPVAPNSYSCGTAANRWLQTHAFYTYTEFLTLSGTNFWTGYGDGVLKSNSMGLVSSSKISNIDCSGLTSAAITFLDTVPSVNNSYNLGLSGTRWNTLYSSVGDFSSSVLVNNISERTANNGVMVDGMLIKDSVVYGSISGNIHVGNTVNSLTQILLSLSGPGSTPVGFNYDLNYSALSGALYAPYVFATCSGLLRGTLSGTVNGTGTISGTLNGTTTTQAIGNNSTSIASTAYVDRFWTRTIHINASFLSGAALRGTTGVFYYDYIAANLSGSSSGSYTFTAPCAGTYTFAANMGRNNNNGIANLYINGVNISSQDCYFASNSVIAWVKTGISLSGGTNTIEIRNAGKHASSVGYYVGGDCILTLTQTA